MPQPDQPTIQDVGTQDNADEQLPADIRAIVQERIFQLMVELQLPHVGFDSRLQSLEGINDLASYWGIWDGRPITKETIDEFWKACVNYTPRDPAIGVGIIAYGLLNISNGELPSLAHPHQDPIRRYFIALDYVQSVLEEKWQAGMDLPANVTYHTDLSRTEDFSNAVATAEKGLLALQTECMLQANSETYSPIGEIDYERAIVFSAGIKDGSTTVDCVVTDMCEFGDERLQG